MSSKIYTKRGDKGQTSLLGGEAVPKSHGRLHAYGTIDELNATVGIVHAELNALSIEMPHLKTFSERTGRELQDIQNTLFIIGGLLACESEEMKKSLPQIDPHQIKKLESSIDSYSKDLSPLRNFILPGGGKLAAYMHLARTIARRAERYTVSFLEATDNPSESNDLVQYLNRLSDYFFVLARYANHQQGYEDITWKK